MSRDPDRQLLAALDAVFAALDLAPALVSRARREWHSVTFAGEVLRFRYGLEDHAIEPRLGARLRDYEFDLPGCLVADAAVHPCAGGFEIELLTIGE